MKIKGKHNLCIFKLNNITVVWGQSLFQNMRIFEIKSIKSVECYNLNNYFIL